jgi:hypothetical protein
MRVALGAIALILMTASLALADFADCMTPGYLAAFPDAPTSRDLTCVEHFRFSVSTPDGPRQVRAISDVAADWAVPPATIAAVERGARLAGEAFAGLGQFSIDNVTLLLLDDVHSSEELTNHGTGREVLGVALAAPDADRAPECLITIYGLAREATTGAMPVTVAHEIFHCVQGATYAGTKYQSYGDGAAWWIEGAAEAFAAAAIPESAAHTDRSAAFDAAVEARLALNDMEHEAVHFFYWLMQTHGGLAALMPFQDAMAATGGAAAQQAAMRAARPAEDWAAFAQAYADGTIRHPQGGPLASSPPEGTVLAIEAAGRHALPMDAFTITLGRAEYGCGVWENTPRPSAPYLTWTAGDDWQALPDEIDTREAGSATWRLVAMPVEAGEGGLKVERRRSCLPCQGSDALDACLFGTWEMSGGGPAEWMRAQGISASFSHDGDRHMTLRADGVFGTSGFAVSSTQLGRDILWEGEGAVTGAAGGWSAEGGLLNLCIEAGGGMRGTVTGTTPEGSREMPANAPPGGSMSLRYSCTGGTLTTVMTMPGLPDMVTDYRKIAE